MANQGRAIGSEGRRSLVELKAWRNEGVVRGPEVRGTTGNDWPGRNWRDKGAICSLRDDGPQWSRGSVKPRWRRWVDRPKLRAQRPEWSQEILTPRGELVSGKPEAQPESEEEGLMGLAKSGPRSLKAKSEEEGVGGKARPMKET